MAKTETTVNTGNYDYTTARVRDPKTGKLRFSASNDDAVARAMLVHLAAGGTIKQVVAANGVKVKNGGNPGLYRMSVGTVLRGMVRRKVPVKIGALTVKTLEQRVALPKVEAAAASRKKAKAKAKGASRKAKSPDAAADGAAASMAA